MSTLINQTYSSQGAPLGEELSLPTNRVYRYTRNGPQPLAAGTVLQGPRPNTSHDNLTCGAAVAGKTKVTLTLAAGDPITLSDYANGYLYINDQAGEGYLYDIVANDGHGFGEDATVVFTIKQQLVVALTTSSQATLVFNPYDQVDVPYGDPWDIIVGVAPVPVNPGEYFWCQVRGPAAVRQHGTLFAGRGVMLSQLKAGAVEYAKQVIPVLPFGGGRELRAGQGPSEPATFQQRAAQVRIPGDQDFAGDEDVLTQFAGQPTIPERIIGYCINPRVSEEYALVYLTLS